MGYLQTKLKAIIATIDTWKFKTGYLYDMTSANTPSPFVVTGGAYANFYDPYTVYAVTNANSPTWNTFDSPILNMSKKYIPTKFYFRVGSNTAQSNQTWSIQGSNDNSNWTTISTFTTGNVGSGFGNASGNPTTTLTPLNSVGYQYLRLVKPGTWSGQISGLKLHVIEWYEQ